MDSLSASQPFIYGQKKFKKEFKMFKKFEKFKKELKKEFKLFFEDLNLKKNLNYFLKFFKKSFILDQSQVCISNGLEALREALICKK